MTIKKKKVDFSVKPRHAKDALPATPDEWVLEKKAAEEKKLAEEKEAADEAPQKRLTLNLPAALHTAFKGRCVVEDVTIQDKVRELIERELTAKLPAKEEGGQPV